jgi:hypothetical protein
MAEPTLKDVLNAISKLATNEELAKLDTKVDELRADMKNRFDAVDKRFDDLDEELEKHASRAHRDLDARIGRLEKRSAPKKVSARPLRRRSARHLRPFVRRRAVCARLYLATCSLNVSRRRRARVDSRPRRS